MVQQLKHLAIVAIALRTLRRRLRFQSVSAGSTLIGDISKWAAPHPQPFERSSWYPTRPAFAFRQTDAPSCLPPICCFFCFGFLDVTPPLLRPTASWSSSWS